MVAIKCPSCSFENMFDQPYPYHAGFGDQGFLYNDAGNLTLVWSAFDPAYDAIVGSKNPWALTEKEQAVLEHKLRPAPSGGKWKFANPARCGRCTAPISGPMTQSIYYLKYPGSIDTALSPTDRRFIDVIEVDL